MTKQYHVLIVEDEPLISGALKAKCEIEGLQATVANNGQVGLELALSEHPNFILLDIIMPVMDGMTMLKKLRKDKWGKSALVMLWTNLNQFEHPEDQQKYNFHAAVGLVEQRLAVDYLVKSNWTPEQVVLKIKEKLGLV